MSNKKKMIACFSSALVILGATAIYAVTHTKAQCLERRWLETISEIDFSDITSN